MGGIAISTTPLPWIRRAWIRCWILALCGTLAAQPVWSQNAGRTTAPVPDTASTPHGASPERLQIKILSPAPMMEPAGGLSANQLTVQVVDGYGMPVARATVSFRLPEAGPGGVFLNGLSTEVAITDAQGKASVQGFDWRAEAGSSFLHVIAAYGNLRAGAMVEVQLSRRVAEQPPAAIGVAPSRAANPAPVATAAFPLPPEASASAAASAPASAPSRTSTHSGPSAPSRTNAPESLVKPLPKAPRALEPEEAPPVHASAAATVRPATRVRPVAAPEAQEQETASYVTVKRTRGGGSKMLVYLVVAAAAAGGALAAGMASSKGSGSAGSPTAPGVPTITIGSPSITVSGGTN